MFSNRDVKILQRILKESISPGGTDIETQVNQCIKKINVPFDPKERSPQDDAYKVDDFQRYLARSKDNVDSRNRYRFWTFVALLKLGLECTIPGVLDKFKKQFMANKEGDEIQKLAHWKNYRRRVIVAWQLRLKFGWGVACWVELLGGGDGRGLQSISDPVLKGLKSEVQEDGTTIGLDEVIDSYNERYSEYVKKEVLKCKLTGNYCQLNCLACRVTERCHSHRQKGPASTPRFLAAFNGGSGFRDSRWKWSKRSVSDDYNRNQILNNPL